MNKILLTAILAISISISFSQGMYFNISGGYGVPAPQQTQQGITFQPNGDDPAKTIIVPLINQNISDSAAMKYQNNLYQGYTGGGSLNLVTGYMINPYVGFEVGFTTLLGRKLKGTSTFDAPSPLGDNVTVNTKTWSYGLTMSPGIRLHACKPDAKIVPYGRFALSLPLWGKTIHELSIDAPNYPGIHAKAAIRAETQSVFSIGFNGSIGVGYNITKWVRIFGEVAGQYLFVRSGTTTLTRYDLIFDGFEPVDQLPSFTTFSKVTTFVDKLDETNNTQAFGKSRVKEKNKESYVEEDKPREELRRAANFSAFGGLIGLSFNIHNSMLKKKKKPVPVKE